MSNYYLAGRYGRKLELNGYADQLRARGQGITSRWLSGSHDPQDDRGASIEVQAQWARDDLDDIDQADVLLVFTESPESGYSRGGRHIEVGYALARNLPIVLIGPVENIFYAQIARSWVRFGTFEHYLQWESRLDAHFAKRTGEPTHV